MYGWNQSPTKAEHVSTVNGESVFKVGYRWLVTTHKDGTVTYRKPYETSSDVKTVLPNMRVDDDELCIPVTDFVGVILSRLDPEHLARALWFESDAVREAFMAALAERYESGISDADRRKFIAKVKEEIHSAALDKLRDDMAKLEYTLSQRSWFYQEIDKINAWLRDQGYTNPDGSSIRLKHSDNDPDFKIGGTHWNDARDWWRAEVLRRFPAPEVPEGVS